MGYSNSSLVNCVVKSPNHSGARTHKIDRITPHCVVGQLSAEGIGSCFVSPSREASCNYGIGTDGKVCLVVDEANRSWCSCSPENDQRAITIECASDRTEPYAFNSTVYNKLVLLCTDICKRNNLNHVLWISEKAQSLAYNPKQGECVLTVHRWFSSKSCPGSWMFNRMGNLANDINANLNTTPVQPSQPATSPNTNLKYKIGDIVEFVGTTHYPNSNASSGYNCNSCTAKVTSISSSAKHPYHLIRQNNDSNAVYGWVNASDILEKIPDNTIPAVPFTIEALVPNLEYRNSASINGRVTGQTGKGIFTIIQVENGWGLLKSKVGWVYLGNTSCCKIKATVKSVFPYRVKVNENPLNIRKEPNGAVVGSIKDKGVYTIVDESNGWGLLKSYSAKRNGWISLSYCKKI